MRRRNKNTFIFTSPVAAPSEGMRRLSPESVTCRALRVQSVERETETETSHIIQQQLVASSYIILFFLQFLLLLPLIEMQSGETKRHHRPTGPYDSTGCSKFHHFMKRRIYFKSNRDDEREKSIQLNLSRRCCCCCCLA